MNDGGPAALKDRFAGRTVGVATIHEKESAIGPALMRVLPLAGCEPILGLDTDRFGAFSGEVKRVLDPLATCIAKAKHGAEVSGMDLVIASEGSFGPYPPAPFVSCDEEVLVLFDTRDDSLFTHTYVSLETNFGGEACSTRKEVLEFAERMNFPGHRLVVRVNEQWRTGDAVHKGIADRDHLLTLSDELIAQHGSCWVETDMRAMANPTRMKVIGEATERFARELAMLCPACGALLVQDHRCCSWAAVRALRLAHSKHQGLSAFVSVLWTFRK